MTEQENVFEATEETCEKVSPKSKAATGLLALFVGCYGVDQFYLGKIVPAIISICITAGLIAVSSFIGFIIGFLTGGLAIFFALPFGFFIGLGTMIWPIIRAIRAFTGKEKDKNGYPIVK